MFFSKHFLSLTLTPLILLALAASFYRFIILNEYQVAYEAYCDPYYEECYVGCEDDECSEEYYYKVITRDAVIIEDLCGVDITDCEKAEYCAENETMCTVELCDPEFDECETLTELDEIIHTQDFYLEEDTI